MLSRIPTHCIVMLTQVKTLAGYASCSSQGAAAANEMHETQAASLEEAEVQDARSCESAAAM